MPPSTWKAIISGEFFSLKSLTASARASAAESDGRLVLTEGSITLAQKKFSRNDDRSLSQTDYACAMDALFKLVKGIWTPVRIDAMTKHRENVNSIAQMFDNWALALEYDICQRESAAARKQHDLVAVNYPLLAVLSARPDLMPPRPAKRPMDAAATYGDAAWHKKPRVASHTSGAAAQGPTRMPNHCFRCGALGHLPKQCTATATVTGQLAASKGPGQRPNALSTAAGQAYCYNFARHLVCSLGSDCRHKHACSICGETQHGAARCPAARSA